MNLKVAWDEMREARREEASDTVLRDFTHIMIIQLK